jgi:hypothetical protein
MPSDPTADLIMGNTPLAPEAIPFYRRESQG